MSYPILQQRSGIYVGDTVTVSAKFTKDQFGYSYSEWTSDMDSILGKQGTVHTVATDHITVKIGESHYNLPFFILFTSRRPGNDEVREFLRSHTNAMGFNRGDMVLVTHKFDAEGTGFNSILNGWVGDMDDSVGTIQVVHDSSDVGVYLENGWWYPIWCVTKDLSSVPNPPVKVKMNESYVATVTPNHVTVNGRRYTREEIAKVVQTHAELVEQKRLYELSLAPAVEVKSAVVEVKKAKRKLVKGFKAKAKKAVRKLVKA